MNRTFSVLLIATLVLVLVAGVSMFWKPTAKNTTIREQGFSLTLPGKWIQKPSTDPSRWVYQSEQREQLMVSLLTSTHELSEAEQSDIFHRVVELRRRAETAPPELTPITVTEATFGESGGVLAARYGGIEAARQRRFTCLLLGSRLAVTIFYYEALGSTEEESNRRARTIMNSISVPR